MILRGLQKKFKTLGLPYKMHRAGAYVISGQVTSYVLKCFPHLHHTDLFTGSSQSYFFVQLALCGQSP